MHKFLARNLIMNTNQVGYKKDIKTTDATGRLLNDIVENLEIGHTVRSISDFRKDFDCMSHNIFVLKVAHRGFSGVAQDLQIISD